MYFDPKTNKFPYPMDTDKHYLKVKKNRGIVFDENYKYYDTSKWFRFKRFLFHLVMYIVYPLDHIRLGLKVEGKKNLKKYKKVIKEGVVSVSNHVHMWDYITLCKMIRTIKPYVLSWAPNINGENGVMIRYSGGIPIPENNPRATMAYFRDIKKLLVEDKGWLHIYAEGCMWEFYAPIRPFKRGATLFAVRFNKPIIPIAYSYREPTKLRKKLFKQIARVTAHIGEPIYPDTSIKDLNEREEDLTIRTHKRICELAGIDPKENLYPPIFDNSKRVDYYTSEYGVGYKGSW